MMTTRELSKMLTGLPDVQVLIETGGDGPDDYAHASEAVEGHLYEFKELDGTRWRHFIEKGSFNSPRPGYSSLGPAVVIR